MGYRKVNRDKSHFPIMNELKTRGYSVFDLASAGRGLPDLLVSDWHETVLIEVKESGGKIYVSQLEFISTWKGPAGFARTPDEAADLMKFSDKRLSIRDKDKIAQITRRYRSKTKAKNPEMLVSTFDKLMLGEGSDG